MYEYIEGRFAGLLLDGVVLDSHGIGYKIYVSKTCRSRMSAMGDVVKLWVEPVVREDSYSLYGFMDTCDRDFFRLLQHVSGIGPKLALSLMGGSSVHELANAILQRDIKALSALPGIGKKLAERMALELQDKVRDVASTGPGLSLNNDLAQQAMQALHTLGLSMNEARAAVLHAQQHMTSYTTVGELVQYALSKRKQ